MTFAELATNDVARIYAGVGLVVFFLMMATIFYQGRLSKNGEGAQFLAAWLVSLLVAAVWPLATFIMIVALPFYARDKWKER